MIVKICDLCGKKCGASASLRLPFIENFRSAQKINSSGREMEWKPDTNDILDLNVDVCDDCRKKIAIFIDGLGE